MKPTAEVDFIGFSTTKLGKITLHGTESITGVTVSLLEPILGLTVGEFELTADEIASGEFTIPETDSGDVYMAHMAEYDAAGAFPENLELQVTLRYDSPEGAKTEDYTVQDTPEQGWGVLYWPDDEPETEWSRPGYFRFSTFESEVPVSLVVDEPDRVSAADDQVVLSVSLSIDGRRILPEECEIVEEEGDDPLAMFDESGAEPAHYYYARLFLKRPGWAPEHGTLHLTVMQQLASSGSVWTTEKDVSY